MVWRVVAVCLFLGWVVVAARGQEIIAHRGASFDAPENTLAAFRLAWEQGADGVEGDFYLTADGRIVCIHDRTTRRTTAGEIDLEVPRATFEQLRRADVGRWKGEAFAGQRIPSLEEVLDVLKPGRKFYLEIKSGPEIVVPMRRVLAASSAASEQIVVIAFNPETIARTRELLPELRAYWLVGYRKDAETGRWMPTLDEILGTLARIKAHGLSTQANVEVVDAAFVEAIRKAGYEFHTWTVNDGPTARRFRDLGVDSITTDRPAYLRGQLD